MIIRIIESFSISPSFQRMSKKRKHNILLIKQLLDIGMIMISSIYFTLQKVCKKDKSLFNSLVPFFILRPRMHIFHNFDSKIVSLFWDTFMILMLIYSWEYPLNFVVKQYKYHHRISIAA